MQRFSPSSNDIPVGDKGKSIPGIPRITIDHLLESHSVHFGPPDSASLPESSDCFDEVGLSSSNLTRATNTFCVSSPSGSSLSFDRGYKLDFGQRYSLTKKDQYTQTKQYST